MHGDKPFVLQFRIRFCDRAWTDYKFLGQRTNAGELIAIAQCAALDGVADLLHQLQVPGLPGGIGESEKHFVTLYLCTDTV
jgi:hypothetical protein